MLELLSPAGSMDALRAAVQNGADAVYLGLASCNARQGARNFSPDELREAVKYCHIRGVKVHLTLNTLLSDREMPQAAELIRTAAACDVDAFIVQDLGMVQLCRQMAPQIALHASTQMIDRTISTAPWPAGGENGRLPGRPGQRAGPGWTRSRYHLPQQPGVEIEVLRPRGPVHVLFGPVLYVRRDWAAAAATGASAPSLAACPTATAGRRTNTPCR